ncbi:MAG TPA: Ig-like domain-containing protein [Fermentimonas sp.]|nr:Ig-like domain-containing protein [Fermentimonas sp.]
MKKISFLLKLQNTFTPRQRRYFSMLSMCFFLIILTLSFTQCETDDYTGEIEGVCPEVITTDPVNGATNVLTNKVITATFNEIMESETINESTFYVKNGADIVSGQVTYSGITATFTPTSLLDANTVYTATVTRGAMDPMGNYMRNDTTWSFNTGSAPSVILTDPVEGASNVELNKAITADFSTPMNAATVNSTSFLLKQGTTNIAGIVTYLGVKATFTPLLSLLPNEVYTATITNSVEDVAGNPMINDTTWSFATGSLLFVTITDPLNAASDVPTNQTVKATFNKIMNAATINNSTFTLMHGTTPVLGTVSYDGYTAEFESLVDLLPGEEYTATITTGAVDLTNNSLAANYIWKFTTKELLVPVLPEIINTDPIDEATDVALDKVITATFSKTMDPTTINSSTFILRNGSIQVLGFIDYSGVEGTFTPSTLLLPGTVYTATVTTGAKDLEGNALLADSVWGFTTTAPLDQFTVNLSSDPLDGGDTSGGGSFDPGASVTVLAEPNTGYSFDEWTENGMSVSELESYTFVLNANRTLVANYTLDPVGPAGPLGINLRSAADFAILAGAGVTNTGVTTLVTGDVGSFPTATINGLLGSNVNGTLYTVASPIVGTAKTDLTTAFNDAQSRSLDAISLPGQLGGLTLAPGLYVNASTSGISGTGANGILTLDAGGNPNAVWIFKMGSTLITDAGTSIVLAGGAQAKNIYWSVGTSATLGTNSVFYGNILADQSITLTNGVELIGRALTRVASVTLDTNIVTKP